MSGTQAEQNVQPWRAYLPWALAVLVSGLAISAWAQGFNWEPRAINAYVLFPVLGLVAFSLMWTHYMVGTVKHTFFKGINLADYFRYTGYVVLVAIVLHPGILLYSLWRDGFGLPPGSYSVIVAPGMEWLILLGTVALLAFLAFELHRWFADRPWWRYVDGASDVAMLTVFYHGLRLGAQLQSGWYQTVWLLLGVTLAAALVRKYVIIVRRRTTAIESAARQ